MIKAGHILWAQGDMNSIAFASPKDARLVPRPREDCNLGFFLASKVFLASENGEGFSHIIRRELPDVSVIYPWSRDLLAELLKGDNVTVRMIARNVTNGFKVVMSSHFNSEANPTHMMMNQEALMLIRMAF